MCMAQEFVRVIGWNKIANKCPSDTIESLKLSEFENWPLSISSFTSDGVGVCCVKLIISPGVFQLTVALHHPDGYKTLDHQVHQSGPNHTYSQP